MKFSDEESDFQKHKIKKPSPIKGGFFKTII
jgi:hypothetical protein